MGDLRHRVVLSIVLGAATALSGGASAAEAPRAIEAYGDSITAGFLSHTSLVKPPPFHGENSLSTIITDLANFLFKGEKDKLRRHHAPLLAWPAVLAQSFGESGAPVLLSNLAVSGSRVSDLIGQVARAGKETAEGTEAFFFIGHNDLCNNLADPAAIGAHFANEYRRALTAWNAKHQGSTAFVMPLGDVGKVFRSLQGYTWYQGEEKRFTCEDSWERLFWYCPSHSRRLKAGTLDDYMTPRLREVALAIQRVTEEMERSSGKNRFRFVDGGVMTRPYEPRFFAVDCYHLSSVGQRELALEMRDYLDKL